MRNPLLPYRQSLFLYFLFSYFLYFRSVSASGMKKNIYGNMEDLVCS